jgi:hypothetical protein
MPNQVPHPVISGPSGADFSQLMSACREMTEWFPDGMAFIGGIAIYLHSLAQAESLNLAEETHDADVYMSQVDLMDLKDICEVINNKRLGKHQVTRHGFEFDIYTEHQNRMPLTYASIISESVTLEGFRVACLEHLLILKLRAYDDRQGSSKGEKDARDIIRIARLLAVRTTPLDVSLLSVYLVETDPRSLAGILSGPAILQVVEGNAHEGNAHEGKVLRQAMASLCETIKKVDQKVDMGAFEKNSALRHPKI